MLWPDYADPMTDVVHIAQVKGTPSPATCVAVHAIVRALDAQKKTREDHYAQLAAVDQLTRYLEMAQGQTPSRSVKRSAGRGAPAQRLPDVA